MRTTKENEIVNNRTDPLLELLALLSGQAIGLANDRDEVNNLSEVLHGLNVNGLEADQSLIFFEIGFGFGFPKMKKKKSTHLWPLGAMK